MTPFKLGILCLMIIQWSSATRRKATGADHKKNHDHTVEHGGFRTVLWEAPKDLRTAVEDIAVFLNYLQKCHRDLSQGATAQLLVLCNRTAVHNQLLQHGFQAAWFGGPQNCYNLLSSGCNCPNCGDHPDRVWIPEWWASRGLLRRQRRLLW